MKSFMDRILPIRDKMYRFSMRIVGNASDAEDVVQDVFVRMWTRKNQLDGIHNLEAWCMTLTKNLSIDKIRARKRTTHTLEEAREVRDAEPTPYQVTARNEKVELVHEMIGSLPEKQKMIIHLRDIEQMSYKEICEITGYSLSQVKINLHRGRKQLKEKLQKFYKND
jgi:RNA polymerase sigma factor (sigma-70 family)